MLVYHHENPIGPTVHWVWMDWVFAQRTGSREWCPTLWLSCTGGGGWIGTSDRLPGVTSSELITSEM